MIAFIIISYTILLFIILIRCVKKINSEREGRIRAEHDRFQAMVNFNRLYESVMNIQEYKDGIMLSEIEKKYK